MNRAQRRWATGKNKKPITNKKGNTRRWNLGAI